MNNPYRAIDEIKSEGAELQLRDALKKHLFHVRDLAAKASIEDYRSFKARVIEIRSRLDDALLIYEATSFDHEAPKKPETILP